MKSSLCAYRRKWNLNSLRSGAATVEFALVISVLFVLIFAAIEFARAGIVKHSADNAAYEGARYAMIPGADAKEARKVATSILTAARIRNPTVSVSPDPITDSASLVTVTVSIPMNSNSWHISQFFRGKSFTSSVTLHTERAPIIQAQAIPQPAPPPTNPSPPPTQLDPVPLPPPPPSPPPSSPQPTPSR